MNIQDGTFELLLLHWMKWVTAFWVLTVLASTSIPPAFVGTDYFCDTGSSGRFEQEFYSADPLWDGAGCGLYKAKG